MRVIVAGSRSIHDYEYVKMCIDISDFEIDTVVSGGARGVDSLAKKWAIVNDVEYDEYPADWEEHGVEAGPIRNKEMAHEADACIAIWDGESKGTANMINVAKKFGLPTEINTYSP